MADKRKLFARKFRNPAQRFPRKENIAESLSPFELSASI